MDNSVFLDRHGDQEGKRFVAIFVEELNRACNVISGLVATGDREGVRQEAHTMAGSAAAVGALAVQHAFYALEKAAETGDRALQPLLALAVAERNRFLSEHYSF